MDDSKYLDLNLKVTQISKLYEEIEIELNKQKECISKINNNLKIMQEVDIRITYFLKYMVQVLIIILIHLIDFKDKDIVEVIFSIIIYLFSLLLSSIYFLYY